MTTLFPQIKRVDEDETSKIIKNVLFSNQDDTKLDKILEEFMHLTEELSCSDVDDDLDDVEIKAEPLVLDHQQRQQHQLNHHHSRPSGELTNGKSNLNNHDKNGPVRNKPSDHSGGENDDEEDGDEDEDDDEDDIDDDDEDEDSEDDDDDDDDSSESEEEKQESTPPREPTSWNLDQFISIPAKQKQQPPPPPPVSSVTQSQATPASASNNHHHHHNNNHSSIPPSSQPSPAQPISQPKHSKHHKHQKQLELTKEKEREREKEREIKREIKKERERERDRERELELERERQRERDREAELEKQRQQQRELEKQQKLEQQRELEKQQQLQQQRELEKQQLQQQRELEKQKQREIEKKQQQEQREIERKPQQQDLQPQQRENEKQSSDKDSCIVQIDLSKLSRIPQTKVPTPNVTGSSCLITAKALKHEADAEKDKTKQAIKYLESCMYFVLHGQEMELANNDTQYYSSIFPLFRHVVKITSPHSLENLDNMTNLKTHALALKCMSLLQMKMYKARERDLPALIKTTSASSPVHQAEDDLLGIKPHVLSAYKRQIAIYNYLRAAHDYWHNVEQLCDQHPALRIFFSTIESNCGLLTMVSPFPKLMDHVQCGLKLLRTS